MGKEKAIYTEQSLYGADGRPHPSDIDQDDIFNCYLVASMGALAEKQPDRIRDAIRYEPNSNGSELGTFHVTLYRPNPDPALRQIVVEVTQADIEDNIRRNGGGTADNKMGSPIWASVMETAFAKLHDPDPARNGLDDAYRVIGSPTRGGSLSAGMYALTGESGEAIRVGERPVPRTDGKPLSAPPGSTGEASPFDVSTRARYVSDESAAFSHIRSALDAGRPVTLSTLDTVVNDGLMSNHAYMVKDIQQQNEQVWVTLRNPYAENRQEPPERGDTSRPEIRVSLERMVGSGAFGEFNIGPAPRLQARENDAPDPSLPGPAAPAASAPSAQVSSLQAAASTLPENDPRNPAHPDHRLYRQIEDGVRRIDAVIGRNFDIASERLTMTAFHDAKAAGITSADHVAMNTAGKPQLDGSQAAAGTALFVVQGKDPSDPAALRSITDVKQAVERPVEQALQNIERLEQQQAQSREQIAPTQDNPTPKGLTL